MKTLLAALLITLPLSAFAAENTKSTPAAPKSPAKLIAAAKAGDIEMIGKQVKRGVDINATTDEVDAYTALGWAAYYGHKEAVKLLLDLGANIDAANRSGYTPLMAAAQQSHDRVARLLLDEGANPNLATLNGDTALIYASMFGSPKTVEALLAVGADPRATNKLGDTAATLADALGRKEIAIVLAKAE